MIESLFVDPVLMTKNIIKNEGWESLYNGLLSAQVGIGYSSAVYFFLFNYFKVHAVSLKSQRRMQTLAASTAAKKVSLGPIENLLVASIAGFINVFCTMPVWVVNTQMASAKKGEFASTWDCVKNIYGKHNMRGFYKGLIPALILVSNPAIQFMSYEHMMHLLLKRTSLRSSKQLSALQLFMMGALAKALATLATYPYQVLKSRLQSQHHNYDSTLAAVLSMWKDEGPGSFFEGMSAKMFQTVLNSAFLFLFKERLFFIVRYLLRLRRKRLA